MRCLKVILLPNDLFLIVSMSQVFFFNPNQKKKREREKLGFLLMVLRQTVNCFSFLLLLFVYVFFFILSETEAVFMERRNKFNIKQLHAERRL